MKVVVVEEMRPSFRQWLRSFRDVQVVGEAATATLAEALLVVTEPDVLLLDVHTSGEDGMRAARRIRARFPRLRMLVVGAQTDWPFVAEALRLGASACVLGQPTPQTLLYLLSQAARGRRLDLVRLEAAVS